MTRSVRVSWAVACAAILAAGAGALDARVPGMPSSRSGQDPAKDPQAQKPTFRTAANYVSVDVYPTVDGKAVPDLTAADFEVLEDGVPQRIETFEHVTVRAPGAEVERVEPRSVEQSNDAAADPRNRLFVLFLDSYHTSVDATTSRLAAGAVGGGTGGSRTRDNAAANSRIGRALAKFLESLIGPDDLIALMRPETPVSGLSFTRRPSSFEDYLLTGADWQRRFVDWDLDQTEQTYVACYPDEQDAVAEMIARRREAMVIAALRDLVLHLQALREGRKAILVVSEGWQLFRRSPSLAASQDGRAPGPPPIGVVGGTLTLGDSRLGVSREACDRDRLMLSDLDDERDFREMLDQANRANVTFYPIDPRGLPVFDGMPGGSVVDDQAALRGRLDSLQTLASATDGIASVNSNDFARSFRRIADDLGSYYLLGYYATNTKADGRFRSITVRVKRPNVDVRARRGYRAPTEEEVAARAAAVASATRAALPNPLGAALGTLAAVRPDTPVRAQAGYGWRAGAGDQPGASIWVVGDLDPSRARGSEWQEGATAAITVTPVAGGPALSADAHLSTAARSFSVQLPADQALGPGDYNMRVAWRGPSLNTAEVFRLTVPAPAAGGGPFAGQPIFQRRGPFTGAARYQPTADPRFRRQERLRVDLPVAGAVAQSEARLLDRAGQPLQVPVTVGRLEHEGGFSVVTAELALAPLAPGDYVVEITLQGAAGRQQALAAFRIIP